MGLQLRRACEWPQSAKYRTVGVSREYGKWNIPKLGGPSSACGFLVKITAIQPTPANAAIGGSSLLGLREPGHTKEKGHAISTHSACAGVTKRMWGGRWESNPHGRRFRVFKTSGLVQMLMPSVISVSLLQIWPMLRYPQKSSARRNRSRTQNTLVRRYFRQWRPHGSTPVCSSGVAVY